MDRFDAMRVFTRVMERRSFTKAAEDLGLPRSSVTDAVKGVTVRRGPRASYFPAERRSRIVGSSLCISMRPVRVSIPNSVNAITPSSVSP
jgi:hypothetical protein